MAAALRMGTKLRALAFPRFGRPEQVLSYEPVLTRSALKAGQVRVKVLSSPLHPADLAKVKGWLPSSIAGFSSDAALFEAPQGSSPSQERPWVGGSEGVAEVVEAAGAFSVGQKVLFRRPTATWADELVVAAEGLAAVPAPLQSKLDYAAMLTVAPSAAARLVADFCPSLGKGDVLVQNAASGPVPQTVVQLAHARGIKPINALRTRGSGTSDTIERIKAYGGHLVVDEAYVRTPEFARLVSDMPKPKLALDAVGGASATELARLLGPSGTLVSYGCMSGKPVQLPSSLFLYKDLTVRGFSLYRWYAQNGPAAQDQLWQHLAELVHSGELRFWIERHRASDFSAALLRSHSSTDRKILLDFAESK